MEPLPKYKMSQELYFLKDNKVLSSRVYSVTHEYGYAGGGAHYRHVTYDMNPYGKVIEEFLFPSKEELLKSL